MTPFPSNRKDPFQRLRIRAYDLHAYDGRLSTAEIAIAAGVTAAHVYAVTKPTKSLHGASADKVADELHRIYTEELGAEVGREIWNGLWTLAQEQAAEGTKAFNDAMQELEKSHALFSVDSRARRRVVRSAFEAAHATVAGGELAEIVR